MKRKISIEVFVSNSKTKQANSQRFFQHAYYFQTIPNFVIFHFMKNSRVTLIRNQDLVFIFFKLVAQKLKLLPFQLRVSNSK